VADALLRVIDRDWVFRYGGDEFAVILVDRDEEAAISVAEQLKSSILGISEPGGGITASLGVAVFPRSAESAEQLVYRADMAMYWAKSSGKNRVERWNDAAWRVADIQLTADRGL
jgi:diguanylate cyclase (GGDEF)-like protein